ncbi:MAG: hypothetical protein E5V86_24315, partial [Mesorhizobium sp.]
VQESGFQPSDKPITVDNVVANAKLAEMAKAQHPRILATYGGEYSDPKLERMVAKVVGNLTVVSANPTQTYRITILNSPNVNAFALPGGYLYVTRGLLALANDSSELAAVIAHEMGHVTANHGLQRQQLEAEEGLARNFGPPGVGTRDRDAFLAGIDGLLYGDTPEEGYVRGQTFMHPNLGVSFTVPDGFVIDNSAAAVTATGPGDIAIRFDGVAIDKSVSLTDYIRSGWVAGLEDASVRQETINGNEAAMAHANAQGWQFDIAVIRAGGQVYRLLTAAPSASASLDPVARSVSGSFRVLSPAEKAALKPLHIRVVTVQAGQTMGSLAAQMVGVDRKLDLFRVLNAMSPGASVSAGDKVKIVTDK